MKVYINGVLHEPTTQGGIALVFENNDDVRNTIWNLREIADELLNSEGYPHHVYSIGKDAEEAREVMDNANVAYKDYFYS